MRVTEVTDIRPSCKPYHGQFNSKLTRTQHNSEKNQNPEVEDWGYVEWWRTSHLNPSCRLVFCFVVFQFLVSYGLFQFENTQVTMGPSAAPHPPLGWTCPCLHRSGWCPLRRLLPGMDSGCGCRGVTVAAAILYSRLGFPLKLNGFF